ncbi:MAG: hypothetical protein INR65_14430 [Gluconacetobacter diazotrophicus]|nr:hypothetical protein [Gluconacetobacter diazotrophicus]
MKFLASLLAVAAVTLPLAVAVAKPGEQEIASLAERQIDTTALATITATATDGLAAPATVGTRTPGARVVQAHAETLRPAPLPDPDVDAPGPDAAQIASQGEASLHPSFYSNSHHFAGDGFSPGSTLENEQNNRRKPGGGMSLSIPMQ